MQNTQKQKSFIKVMPIIRQLCLSCAARAGLSWLTLVALMVLPVVTNAQDSFFVDVAVNGQADNEKASAYRVGLRVVLLRNSDDKTLLNGSLVRAALAESESYVQQFGYRVPGADEKITNDTPLTRRVRETAEATHLLAIQFDSATVSELIRRQQEKTLAANKSAANDDEETEVFLPPTSAMVWLLIEDGPRVQIIGGKTGLNVIERAREIAGGIGQSLVFPSLDLTDQQLLNADDIRSGNRARLLTASERYQQPVILTGVLTRTNGRSWTTSWTRYHGAELTDLAGGSSSLDQALKEGIQWLAPVPVIDNRQNTGGGFGRTTSNEGRVWIGSLDTADRYAAVMKLLNSIETVDVVYPSEVTTAGMLFAVLPRSAVSDIAQRAGRTNWLRATASATSVAGNTGSYGASHQADAYFEYLR